MGNREESHHILNGKLSGSSTQDLENLEESEARLDRRRQVDTSTPSVKSAGQPCPSEISHKRLRCRDEKHGEPECVEIVGIEALARETP